MAGKASVENGKKGGRPKGSKSENTLMKEAVLAEFRKKAMESADVLFTSQLHLAKGQTYLYKIEKEFVATSNDGKRGYWRKKKPRIVEAQWEIESYLMGKVEEGDEDDDQDPKATYYFLTVKDPDNKAIDSILDRTFGKSVQSVVTQDENGNNIPITGIVINSPDARKKS